MVWEKIKDLNTGENYFYNSETNEKTLQRPTEGFRIYHILIKHKKSRKPIERTEEEAMIKIKEIYEDLKAHINDKNFKDYFKDQAYKYSECSSSKRGGDLGFIAKNEMLKEFEKPAFMLKRGQIVGPVPTASGYHIIYRR